MALLGFSTPTQVYLLPPEPALHELCSVLDISPPSPYSMGFSHAYHLRFHGCTC